MFTNTNGLTIYRQCANTTCYREVWSVNLDAKKYFSIF
jgi:hypothetical protein